jgi:hypothetical protein
MNARPPISTTALGMTVAATSASAAWSQTPSETTATSGQRSFAAGAASRDVPTSVLSASMALWIHASSPRAVGRRPNLPSAPGAASTRARVVRYVLRAWR